MLRLTGGEFRGRFIQTPHHQYTRPTQAKLRQALFNSLQMKVPKARVLDLFAGSGALGFEALSRGASQVVFIEQSKSTAKIIQKNAEALGVAECIQVRVESSLPPCEKENLAAQSHGGTHRLAFCFPFDLVLADPPYEEGWEMKLLQEWPWEVGLTPGGLFCLEWGSSKSRVSQLPDRVPFLAKVREKIYGDSVLTTYQREG